MGYRKMQFGNLYVRYDEEPQDISLHVPTNPTYDGDIVNFVEDGMIILNGADYRKNDAITWIKPDHMPILVADRVLVRKVSYNDLMEMGYASDGPIGGRIVRLNGIPFCCRLPDGGSKILQGTYDNTEPNEWDACLSIAGDDNGIWHWAMMSFWAQGKSKKRGGNGTTLQTARPARGFNKPTSFTPMFGKHRGKDIGFRPILEPLQSTPFCQYREISLDGQPFCVAQNKLKDITETFFRPAIYPQKKDGAGCSQFDASVFRGVPDGTEIRMYTVLVNGKPVRQNQKAAAPYKPGSEITLTDRYYGDQYLVPWIIHHGCAFAARDILREVSVKELVKQGYLS